LVASLLKRKSVTEAVAELDFLAKRAGTPLRKLLMSAVANAKEAGKDLNDLFIKELRVDKGVTLKRMMPAAMGSGHRINKRTSHITLLLEEKVAKEKTKKSKIKKLASTKASAMQVK